MLYIGYIIECNKKHISVLLPDKPTGDDIVELDRKKGYKFKTGERLYVPLVFDLKISGDSIIDWELKPTSWLCQERLFVALFADGRVLANDGKTYKFYHSDELDILGLNPITDMFRGFDFSSCSYPNLFVKDGLIYGVNGKSPQFRNDTSVIEGVIDDYSLYNPEHTGIGDKSSILDYIDCMSRQRRRSRIFKVF